MNKKALFFTIGAMMVALIILSLSIIILNASENTKLRLAESAAFDKLYDLDNSIQKSLRQIFEEAEIIINVSDISVSFEEDLPNNKTIFVALMNDFKDFVESNEEHVSLNISDITQYLPLVVKPYNITYKHLDFGGKKIRILPEKINFNTISIYAKIKGNITSCDFDVEEGSLMLDVEIVGDQGICSDSVLIDPYGETEIAVNGEKFEIEVENGIFDIYSKSKSRVRTKILFDEISAIDIEYPDAVINTDFQDLNLTKSGYVRIK
ncbi:MAG: hypothetical protein KAU20_04560 [Nanoarchaeota archaeon]|nr:hypothetical protein [Nanoarchaeota archaeon]